MNVWSVEMQFWEGERKERREGGREGEREGGEGRSEDKGERMKVESKEEGGRRGRENDLAGTCSYLPLFKLCPTTSKKMLFISFQ